MIEVLKYIFSSGWIFAGTVCLLIIVIAGVEDIIRAFRK